MYSFAPGILVQLKLVGIITFGPDGLCVCALLVLSVPVIARHLLLSPVCGVLGWCCLTDDRCLFSFYEKMEPLQDYALPVLFYFCLFGKWRSMSLLWPLHVYSLCFKIFKVFYFVPNQTHLNLINFIEKYMNIYNTNLVSLD